MPPTSNLFSDEFWNLLVLIAIFLGLITFFIFLKGQKSKNRLLQIFTLLTLAGTLIQLSTTQIVFGRYWIAFLPYLFASIFLNKIKYDWKADRLPRVCAVILCIFIYLISIFLTLNSFAFDRARWNVASAISATGVPESRIDAGLEWSGWFSENGAEYRFNLTGSPGIDWSHNPMFGNKPCFILTTDKLKTDWTLDSQVFPFKQFLLTGKGNIYVYQTNESSCQMYY